MYSNSYPSSWVFSTSLPGLEEIGHTLYNPSESLTYKVKSGYTWDISYGDGSGASGTVGTDVVTIGGLAVTGQAGGFSCLRMLC